MNTDLYSKFNISPDTVSQAEVVLKQLAPEIGEMLYFLQKYSVGKKFNYNETLKEISKERVTEDESLTYQRALNRVYETVKSLEGKLRTAAYLTLRDICVNGVEEKHLEEATNWLKDQSLRVKPILNIAEKYHQIGERNFSLTSSLDEMLNEYLIEPDGNDEYNFDLAKLRIKEITNKQSMSEAIAMYKKIRELALGRKVSVSGVYEKSPNVRKDSDDASEELLIEDRIENIKKVI